MILPKEFTRWLSNMMEKSASGSVTINLKDGKFTTGEFKEIKRLT
jgi:hypothetical protein